MFVQPFITAERCELNCLYVVNIFLIYNEYHKLSYLTTEYIPSFICFMVISLENMVTGASSPTLKR